MPSWSPDRLSGSIVGPVRSAFVTGVAVVVPLLLSLIVLAVAGRYVYQYLDLFSTLVLDLSPSARYVLSVSGVRLSLTKEALIELLTPLVLASLIVTVGLFINASRFGALAVDYFDAAVAHVPGIGAVYESFRQMSDVMINEDAQNFRDVKLVEFPHEGAYTLGFLTTETPDPLREPAGHDRMLTLFLPLAPNPVMGGHLVHMPADRVMDVDMTVEEGLRAVVTSGVAVSGGSGASDDGLSARQLRTLSRVEHADQRLDPEADSPDIRRSEPEAAERADEWDRQVDPTRSETPTDVARRTRAQRDPIEGDEEDLDDRQPYSLYGNSEATSTPAREAGRYGVESDGNEEVPEHDADRPSAERDGTDSPPAAEQRGGEGTAARADGDEELDDDRARDDGDHDRGDE
ncbi:DUF502 domain-containing protein [Halobaculum magnesiiphilum]|uniref:DUF502 domain-containing protein n=1 Tax=Halobaculum magnesiiphilum TaxID=1017351 RepID=A0A8T8WDJ3_9EURY|nr:DUF502 domain-containing protein [Halobaculum magnesiiphilum]QZP37901.1 DUF502 domain-containing protein [Halobaculum magnesiiphilum]